MRSRVKKISALFILFGIRGMEHDKLYKKLMD